MQSWQIQHFAEGLTICSDRKFIFIPNNFMWKKAIGMKETIFSTSNRRVKMFHRRNEPFQSILQRRI